MSSSSFEKDVIAGLTAKEKHLSSKYLYDEVGSKIFEDIMRMPEYYLTDCEYEIFNTYQQELLNCFFDTKEPFDLIELGAGDGYKTKILLEYFSKQDVPFEYDPIDISEKAVKHLVADIQKNYPSVSVKGLVGDYFQIIKELNSRSTKRKVILFLGSNIGNYQYTDALHFFNQLKNVMHKNDLLLIGFDLKKEPDIILKAYNDPHGHTAKFNLNLLNRINNAFNANFNLQQYEHIEEYSPETGTANSYLISKSEQHVELRDLNFKVDFKEGERIFMEISQKYDQAMIESLAKDSGFEVVRNFCDKRLYFTNSLWKLKS